MLLFDKVSLEQFITDAARLGIEANAAEVRAAYDQLVLPRRQTIGSAGYDFTLPFDISCPPGSTIGVPTGVRAKMPDDVVLLLMPRSSLGIRYRMQLTNTIGVIDSDYVDSDNEGHIMVMISNDGYEQKPLTLAAGERFVQGIFLPYLVTDDDAVATARTGGFGSTSK